MAGLEKSVGDRVQRYLRERFKAAGGGQHWLGRAILITVNSYDVGLMNGDVGVVLPSGPHGELAAVFPCLAPEPSQGATDALPTPESVGSRTRSVALSRLPAHEGALAITIHKSQGSQFNHVAMVLSGRDSPIQTRELVYTAISRAKERLTWLGGYGELRRSLDRQVIRTSGLRERIQAKST